MNPIDTSQTRAFDGRWYLSRGIIMRVAAGCGCCCGGGDSAFETCKLSTISDNKYRSCWTNNRLNRSTFASCSVAQQHSGLLLVVVAACGLL